MARPDVLGHHGGHAGAEVDDGQQKDRVHPIGGSDGGHRLVPEAVHKPLEEDIPKGGGPGLDGRRDTEAGPLAGGAPAEHAPPGPEKGVLFPGVPQDINCHGDLRQDSGDGRPRRTHAQTGDKDQVQKHVDDTAYHNGGKGGFAVPQPPEDGAAGVVQGQEGDAGKHDAQVVLRVLEDVRRGVQADEDILHKHSPKGADSQIDPAQDQAEGRQEGPQVLRPSHAEPLGGQHGQSGGEAHDDHDEHGVGGGDRADASQGQLPLHVAHDKGVHPVEQLLEHPAEDQRHGKGGQRPSDAPLGHVVFHVISSHYIRK